MLALVQRVLEAGVSIDGVKRSSIGPGLLVFVCATPEDTDEKIGKMVKKILKLRIFPDDEGRMNRSILDTQGEVLVVSQFTLAADTRSGNRPGFSGAANPELGRYVYERFLELMRLEGVIPQTGEFGADMKVNLINDGPATFWLSL
ncbi:MAG: D-aminoacyl-tRNA deacylase [Sutterella sp.]|nr:D-aminoacyl-tRNA deacylase [Sutterella sp.]